MKKLPYESPKLELQWLLSEAVCAGNGMSFGEGYTGEFGDDDIGEELPD